MKRTALVFFVVTSLLLSAVAGGAPPQPGTEAWLALDSKAARVAASQLGDETIGQLDDAALVDAVLAYPFLVDLLAFDSPTYAVQMKMLEHDGMAALSERPEAATALLDAYRSIPLDAEGVERTLATRPEEEAVLLLAGHQLRSQLLEALLSHPRFLEPLLDQHAGPLAEAVAAKHGARVVFAGVLDPPDPTTAALLDTALAHPALDAETTERLAETAGLAALAAGTAGSCLPIPPGLVGVGNTATTPGCTDYPVCKVTQDWSSAFRASLTAAWTQAYGQIATQTAPVSKKTICHSYAVFDTLGGIQPGCANAPEPPPIGPHFVQIGGNWLATNLIADHSVIEVTDPDEALLAFYALTGTHLAVLNRNGYVIDHSARPGATGCPQVGSDPAVDPALGTICLESKWGWAGPRMKHMVGNDPYSGTHPDFVPNVQGTNWSQQVFANPSGKQIDLRLFEAMSDVRIDLTPSWQTVPHGGGSRTLSVDLYPTSAGLVWSAAIVQGGFATVSANPPAGQVTVTLPANPTPVQTRTVRVRVSTQLPDGSTVSAEADLVQDGAPPPIPATPAYVGWPQQHCTETFGQTYTIAPVPFATSYVWSVTNPAITLLGGNPLSRQVHASGAGTSGHLRVKACNTTGCSAETSVLLYFVDCGGGGGPN